MSCKLASDYNLRVQVDRHHSILALGRCSGDALAAPFKTPGVVMADPEDPYILRPLHLETVIP